MIPDFVVKLIVGAVILVSLAAAYCAGRSDGRRKESCRQSQEPPTYMDHEHGGDCDAGSGGL